MKYFVFPLSRARVYIIGEGRGAGRGRGQESEKSDKSVINKKRTLYLITDLSDYSDVHGPVPKNQRNQINP